MAKFFIISLLFISIIMKKAKLLSIDDKDCIQKRNHRERHRFNPIEIFNIHNRM